MTQAQEPTRRAINPGGPAPSFGSGLGNPQQAAPPSPEPPGHPEPSDRSAPLGLPEPLDRPESLRPLPELAHPQLTPGGQILGADGAPRPPWAYQSELLRDYFDDEWGRFVITEHGLLERLSLEGFQSGLSWALVLRKRRAFRDVFFLFDAPRIHAMTPQQRADALADERLIRNRLKQAALYRNAEATLRLREDPALQALPEGHPAHAVLGGLARRLPPGLPVLVWSFTPEARERPRHVTEVASTSAESAAMAAELRKRGFSFVGPTTCYALMQAIGMVNDRVLEPEG